VGLAASARPGRPAAGAVRTRSRAAGARRPGRAGPWRQGERRRV